MKAIFRQLSVIVFLSSLSQISVAEMQPIVDIPKQWNKFVDDLVSLNNRLIKETSHSEKWRIGGYSNEPKFFDEATYTNKETDTVTSIVQWERANPEAVHSIEIKLWDEQGRITKDFSASYLTKHRNAPIQTLITIHYYNKDLHGFRVFDASHTRIYDVCRGKYKGKVVNIDLDDDYGELSEALENKKGIMSTAAYKACFGGRYADKSRLNIPSE